MSTKDPVLRARVDEETKRRFEAICQHYDETVSDRLRQLVEEYVRAQSASVERINVRIERPAGYDLGAWRVTAVLATPAEATWNGTPITFELPELPKRHFVVSDSEYRAAVLTKQSRQPVIGGKFHEGIWRADVYSNGVREADNPTPVESIKQALVDSITDTLARFHST